MVTSAGLPLRKEGSFFVDLRVLRAFVVRSCCVLAFAGCRSSEPAINLKTWNVVAIGSEMAPVGAGGHYLTMYFGPATGRVSGFSGCNQYNGPYTLVGDSIAIGPLVSTKMACVESMDIESRFLSALPALTHWQVTESTLTLTGPDGMALKLTPGEHP
ncbi:MAG: META domain-containing protein [Gemmatimonadetes bacterium]|nr:META domain-containing protein [Gemmatimonadota bacterium]